MTAPTFRDPKFVIAFTIIGIFAAAYFIDPDETMKGAIIAAFAGAWGYYLGSSNSSNAVREQVGQAQEIAKQAQELAKAATPDAAEPDVILKPGETALAGEPDGSK